MAAILIVCYQRSSHLQYNLATLLGQDVNWKDHEIIILNDGVEDCTLEVARFYAEQGLPIRYLFTGQRNRDGMKWRVPGFAWNIGIKECDSEIVVLTCAEMYHVGETLNPILLPVMQDNKALGTPKQIYDDSGPLIDALLNNQEGLFQSALEQSFALKPSPFRPHQDMPFWMAINRKQLLEIGGFDEDFTGIASDDNDLMNRLLAVKCHYNYVYATVVHLFHGRRKPEEVFRDKRFKFNRELMNERKKFVIRNKNRKWGELTEKFRDLAEYEKHETFTRDHQVAATVLWNLLPPDYSILDVGCGDCTIINHIRAKVKCSTFTIDGWPATNPDLLINLEKNELPFQSNTFDVILLLDLIEHLEKDCAIRLIKQCQQICKIRIIVYTPKQFETNQSPYDNDPIHKGNKLIIHKSSWSEEDLISLGFQIQDKFTDYHFAIWEKP